MSLVNPAQPAILQEVPFGGYRVTLKFQDWFWDNQGGAARVDELLTDLYATPPGGGAPIPVGGCEVQFRWDATLKKYVVIYTLVPSDGHYFINAFPAMPSTYWSEPDNPNPTVPMFVTA
jgi:hypothetical protein